MLKRKLWPKRATGAGARVRAQNNSAVVCDADDGGPHRVWSVKIARNCVHDAKIGDRLD